MTGAAQGIGRAIALALAERGAQVIATDLTPPHETVNKIGPSAHAFQLDVTQEEDWRSVALESRDVGEVDIVVNNAGYFPNRSIDELDLPTWRKTMATNLDSQFLSVKYFLAAMRKKKWGRFVGISSNMVGLAIPGMSHYIATKMGIIGFMRGLANDVASDGITANAVLPGLTNTLATAPQSEEQKRATWEQQAIKRLGEPRGYDGRYPVLDERRCCVYHRAGYCGRRRSVSDRLRPIDARGHSSAPYMERKVPRLGLESMNIQLLPIHAVHDGAKPLKHSCFEGKRCSTT